MYKIKGAIKGTADILFNRMTEQTKDSLRTGRRGGKMTDDDRVEEAHLKYPKDENGKAYMDSWMFKKVLAAGAGAANLKEGRRSLGPFLLASVFVDGKIYMSPEEPSYIHEVPGKRPPKTGGACMIKRPAFENWTASFVLNVLDDRRDAESIRVALEEAGTSIGAGSFRPEYGRFIVIEWEVIKDGKAG